MNKIAEKLVNWQIRKNIIKAEDRPAYVFAYETLLLRIMNFLIAVAVGLLMKNLLGVLVFLAAYIPLRTHAGGYHARNSLNCTILSTIMIIIVAFVTKLSFVMDTPGGVPVFFVLGIVCYAGILIMSPVADENKPLSDDEIKKYGKRAYMIGTAEAAVAAVCLWAGQPEVAAVLILVLVIMAFMLLLGIFNNKRLQGEPHK